MSVRRGNGGRVENNIIITEDEIRKKVATAGHLISMEYKDKPLLILGILNGSFVFVSDLCRNITIPCEIEFMRVRSYFDSTVSSGSVEIISGLNVDVSKYNVIIAEDIIDTGRTLKEVVRILLDRAPQSLKIITLLDKPARRKIDLKPDIALFTIPDMFVVGYGLDYNGLYRNLPYISKFEKK